jgi:hypothetical protein
MGGATGPKNNGDAEARKKATKPFDQWNKFEITSKDGVISAKLNGVGLCNLGIGYGSLGEIQKATSLLQQAKAIGEQIGDPRIVQSATRALEVITRG